MKAVTRILATGLCSVILAVTSSTALGQFSDNFDSYVAGSNIHGQGGWKGWDNVAGAGALVSSAFSLSSPNSVNITGGSDLVHTFSGINSGLWSLSINQYVPGNSTGNSYFILLNQYNDGGPYNWSVQIQNNMDTGVVTSDIGGGATRPLVRDAWNTFRFDFNFGSGTVSEYYNGSLLSTHPLHDGTGQNALGGIDLFANGAAPVYYDNLSITMIPEPGSLSLLALGGLAFVLRRKAR
jgi:hypothetical protein